MVKLKEPSTERITLSNLVLKVKAYSSISKPLNGSLPSSNSSHLLKLFTFPYTYKSGKDYKQAEATAYFIKGIRGVIRHQAAILCKNKGLDVCHSTDKEKDKHGNSLLPTGYHLLGSCTDNGECILHSIFGSKRNPSKIRVYALPIANITHKTFQTEFKIQNVQISTENRIICTYDGQSVQNFKERYFSGVFEFEIEVTDCTSEELGLLIETVVNLKKIGRGYNTGYGDLNVIHFQLVQRTTSRSPQWNDEEHFVVHEDILETPLKEKVEAALNTWQKYPLTSVDTVNS